MLIILKTILGKAKVNKSRRLAQAFADRKQAEKRAVTPLPALPNPDYLILSDFIDDDKSADKAREAFKNMVNVGPIMMMIDDLEATITQAKLDGKSPADILANTHMVFTGPPGTGVLPIC